MSGFDTSPERRNTTVCGLDHTGWSPRYASRVAAIFWTESSGSVNGTGSEKLERMVRAPPLLFFDESGGWYDHVPPPQLANAMYCLAAKDLECACQSSLFPLRKTNYISHQQMDLSRSFGLFNGIGIWGDPKCFATGSATREQQSGDLCDMLTSPCGAPTAP